MISHRGLKEFRKYDISVRDQKSNEKVYEGMFTKKKGFEGGQKINLFSISELKS